MKKIIGFLLFVLVFCMATAFGEEVPAELKSILTVFGPIVLGFMAKYPVLATIIMIIGTARLVMKPIMSILLVVFAATPSTKDDEWLEKLKQNKIYKIVVYILDWGASLKLPKE